MKVVASVARGIIRVKDVEVGSLFTVGGVVAVKIGVSIDDEHQCVVIGSGECLFDHLRGIDNTLDVISYNETFVTRLHLTVVD